MCCSATSATAAGATGAAANAVSRAIGNEAASTGVPATIADARFAKPLDTDLVERLAKEHEVLITIEEGSIGGFAARVMDHLIRHDKIVPGLKIRPMTLPDKFQNQASPFDMYDEAELNARHITATALEALGINSVLEESKSA